MDRSIDGDLFRMSGRIVFISVILVLISVGMASAAVDVDSCRTINVSGVYVLNQSINNYTSGTCITIESSNVTFDGADRIIDGNDTGTGIYVYNSTTTLTNVTVRNVKLTDWWYGIYYQNAENGSITNNIALNNSEGIYLASSSNNTIANNTADLNSDTGIFLKCSEYNDLINNGVSNNSYGINLMGGDCVILSRI